MTTSPSSPCDLDATQARRMIGAKELSPVELTQSCIRRIEAVDHAVNAVVARDFERALETAKHCETAVMRGEPLGSLHGLPVGIKDALDTAGLRSTYGSLIFKDHVPNQDEGVVASLRAAGAIVLGKTNVPEWSAGANTRNAIYGATGNPFDPTRSAAGSRAARRPRSRAAWCRSRRDPTPAVRCAIRRPSVESSAFGRHRASFPARNGTWPGSSSRRLVRWDERCRTLA